MSELSSWDLFVLRHSKRANLGLHFVSATMFVGSPLYGLLTFNPTWFFWWCLSGCIGTAAHYVTKDGTVTFREATSSPKVVGYNGRMWWRIATRRYGQDIAQARAKLAKLRIAEGRSAVVTGCSSGFGHAIVRTFLARGFKVIGTVRKKDAAFDDLPADQRARLTLLEVDLTRDWQKLVDAAATVDCVVLNAGAGLFGALEDVTEDELREHMEVNFFASALLARAFAPKLRASNGTLVFVSSPAGLCGFPWTSAYAASKHALEGLAESLYYELKGTARVHLLTPSAHKTSFMKNARWAQPPASAYRASVAGYRAVMERNQAKPLPPPDAVAEVVGELCERGGYGFRVDIGNNVRILRAMVRFLPSFVRHALVSAVFAKAKAPEPVPACSASPSAP
ncbi:MAG TPA: SDR family NAD(P)-dependent oxidoreductase [Labilithrix sp.]|nr:SDR family NAD(P)-dependent oxidoreductase [Labilithrix sp.]